MTNVKRSEIKEYKKPFVKGKFKTYIPTPGDTYKADINIMKKSKLFFEFIDMFSFTLIVWIKRK